MGRVERICSNWDCYNSPIHALTRSKQNKIISVICPLRCSKKNSTGPGSERSLISHTKSDVHLYSCNIKLMNSFQFHFGGVWVCQIMWFRNWGNHSVKCTRCTFVLHESNKYLILNTVCCQKLSTMFVNIWIFVTYTSKVIFVSSGIFYLLRFSFIPITNRCTLLRFNHNYTRMQFIETNFQISDLQCLFLCKYSFVRLNIGSECLCDHCENGFYFDFFSATKSTEIPSKFNQKSSVNRWMFNFTMFNIAIGWRFSLF